MIAEVMTCDHNPVGVCPIAINGMHLSTVHIVAAYRTRHDKHGWKSLRALGMDATDPQIWLTPAAAAQVMNLESGSFRD